MNAALFGFTTRGLETAGRIAAALRRRKGGCDTKGFPSGGSILSLVGKNGGRKDTRGKTLSTGFSPWTLFPRRPKWAVCPLWKPPHGRADAVLFSVCSRVRSVLPRELRPGERAAFPLRGWPEGAQAPSGRCGGIRKGDTVESVPLARAFAYFPRDRKVSPRREPTG